MMRTIVTRMVLSFQGTKRTEETVPPLSVSGRRCAERRQVPQQIVGVAIVQPVGAVHRHQRLCVECELGQVRLEISLKLLARVHDLYRELVFVLPDASNPLPVAGDERHRLVSRPDDGARAAQFGEEPHARPRRSDPREIGAQLSAATAYDVTGAAI